MFDDGKQLWRRSVRLPPTAMAVETATKVWQSPFLEWKTAMAVDGSRGSRVKYDADHSQIQFLISRFWTVFTTTNVHYFIRCLPPSLSGIFLCISSHLFLLWS